MYRIFNNLKKNIFNNKKFSTYNFRPDDDDGYNLAIGFVLGYFTGTIVNRK
jgi:hypothetical protein